MLDTCFARLPLVATHTCTHWWFARAPAGSIGLFQALLPMLPPCPHCHGRFFGLEDDVLEPPPPLLGSKKRSGRGSKARSEQSMQTPAKGEQPLQLKLSARVTGRVCSCCGKDDRMSDLCQPQYRILWARYIKDDEGDGQSLRTDGACCWYCFRV